MKTFRWQGVDHKGLRAEGEHTAENIAKVRQALIQQHITPLRITQKIKLNFYGTNPINFEDITDFTREIATLISSGISLAAALRVISDSAAKAGIRLMSKSLQKQVESGQLLSHALQLQTEYFDEIFCNLVQVGEHSGRLDNILSNITNYREKIISLRRKIKKALFYPMIVLLIALMVTAGLMVFVIPEFEKLFQGLGAQLPLFTRLVMHVADQFRKQGWIGALIILCVYLLLKVFIKKSTRLKNLFDHLYLRIPLVGVSLRNAIFARCFSTLATALQAGVPLLEAVDLAASVSGNYIYKQAFTQLSHYIKSGHTIHIAMSKIGLFPPRAIQMITIGEESGHLEGMLQKLSDYFEKQVDYLVHNLSQLLEPAIMVFLCILIGSLVIAMYLPIFRLGSVI